MEFPWFINLRRRPRVEEIPFPNDIFTCVYDKSPEPEAPSYLVEGLLPSEGVVLLAGPAKCGKSYLATALAMAVATGVPFLGRETRREPVIWLALEETESERGLALRDYRNSGLPFPSFGDYHTTHERILIDDPLGLLALRSALNGTGARLVVVDCLHAAHSQTSLADSSSARRTLSGLREIARRLKICFLVLHHTSRGRAADSRQVAASASQEWILHPRADHPEAEEGEWLMDLRAQGRGPGARFRMTLASPAPMHYRALPLVEPELPETRTWGKLRPRILEILAEGPLTAAQIATRLDYAAGAVRNTLSDLVRTGQATITRSHPAPTYTLPENGKKENDDDDQPERGCPHPPSLRPSPAGGAALEKDDDAELKNPPQERGLPSRSSPAGGAALENDDDAPHEPQTPEPRAPEPQIPEPEAQRAPEPKAQQAFEPTPAPTLTPDARRLAPPSRASRTSKSKTSPEDEGEDDWTAVRPCPLTESKMLVERFREEHPEPQGCFVGIHDRLEPIVLAEILPEFAGEIPRSPYSLACQTARYLAERSNGRLIHRANYPEGDVYEVRTATTPARSEGSP